MPVTVDSLGRVSVEDHPATRGLAGRTYVRRKPVGGCPGDAVVVGGITLVGSIDPQAELVVSSTTYGACPEGWGSSTESYDFQSFAEQYREAEEVEITALKVDALAATEKATKLAAKRESPWSRS